MSKITLQGTIIDALPMEQGISPRTGNQWQKQTFIIETSVNQQYSTRVAVTSFRTDLISKFLGFPTGSAVEVDCWLESRESQSGRWFTEVTAADIRPRMQYAPQYAAQYQPQQPSAPFPAAPAMPKTQHQPSGQQFRAPQPAPAPAPAPQQQNNDQRFAQQYQSHGNPDNNYDLPF